MAYDSTLSFLTTALQGDLPTLGLQATAASPYVGSNVKFSFNKLVVGGSPSFVTMTLGKTIATVFTPFLTVNFVAGMAGRYWQYTDVNGVVYTGNLVQASVELTGGTASIVPSFSVVEASDGKSITLTDTTQGGVIAGSVRSFILTDYLGNTLTTLTLGASQTSAVYALTAPAWINIEFLNSGTQPFDLTQRYAFYRLFKVLYQQSLKKDCGCGCNGSKTDFCAVDGFLWGAETAIPTGAAVLFQQNINAAYALIQG